jgi:hypothetical protein
MRSEVLKPLPEKYSALVLPVDTLNGTGFNRFFDAVFGSALRHDYFCFFFLFVECKYLGAKLHTTLTSDTFFGVNDNSSRHPLISFKTLR